MVLLQQLEQDIHPVSSYYKPLTYPNRSRLLQGVTSTSAIYYKSSSTKPKSYAQTNKEAAKKHREAERSRRLRTNCQYETLRTILPNLPKKNKATVLAETIRYVTELKKTVKELEADSCSRLEFVLPCEEDKLNLSYSNGDGGLLKVMFSCQDKRTLISDLTRALMSVKGRVMRAEIVTIGGRTKYVLWIQGFTGNEGIVKLRRALKPAIWPPIPQKKGRLHLSH